MARQAVQNQSLAHVAMGGVIWLFAGSLPVRLLTIATVYVTGQVLSKEDFALYAIAIGWGEIFLSLTNGGMDRILIARGRSFHALYPYVLTMSFAINCTWCVLLVVMAPVIAQVYDTAEVRWLIVVIALSIPVATISSILWVKVLIEQRFRELSILVLLTGVIRNGGIISLVLLGFGPMSFAIALVMVAVFEATYLFFRTGRSIHAKLPGRRLVRIVMSQTGWIMFGMLALALAANGDYIVIGAIEEKYVLGVYFFGFQLSLAIFLMFTTILKIVLTPSFATLNTDRRRQDAAVLRSLEVGAFFMFFLSFGVVVVAEPVITWVWAGKWDEAVPVVQIIAAMALPHVVFPIAAALLEARGRWRLGAMMGWISAIGLMVGAAIGALIGGLLPIAVAIGVALFIRGLTYLFVIWLNIEASWIVLLKVVFVPYVIAALSAAASLALYAAVAPGSHPLATIMLCGTAYVVGFAFFAWQTKREMFLDVLARGRALVMVRRGE
jgi:O-antigen/teichoic acid export membrane protein